MSELINFSSSFTKWSFSFSDVTEADYLSRGRAIADIEIPEWKHRAEGDIAWFAYALHVKALASGNDFANQVAQEFTLFTSRQREMILAHAQLMGYTPKSAIPAKVDLLVTLPEPKAARTFQKYELKVTSRNVDGQADEIFFENEEAFSVALGISTILVTFVHGKTLKQDYTSDGQPNQEVTLTELGALDDFTTVTIAAVAWQQVSTFLDSGPTDKHFAIRLDTDGRTVVLFGNGTNGQIPVASSVANIQYRVGVDNSNLSKNSLTYVFESPSPAVVTVEQPVNANGGEPADDKAAIVKGATNAIRQRSFLGTAKEIVAYCEAYSGVARAVVSFIDPVIYACIIPSGGGAASTSLINALRTDLETRVGMGKVPVVDDALQSPPTISVLFTTKAGFVSADVSASIKTEIQSLINPLSTVTDPQTFETTFRRDFGQSLDPNEVRQILALRPDIENDYEVTAPTLPIGVTELQIIGVDGSTVTATSRNTRTTGYATP